MEDKNLQLAIGKEGAEAIGQFLSEQKFAVVRKFIEGIEQAEELKAIEKTEDGEEKEIPVMLFDYEFVNSLYGYLAEFKYKTVFELIEILRKAVQVKRDEVKDSADENTTAEEVAEVVQVD